MELTVIDLLFGLTFSGLGEIGAGGRQEGGCDRSSRLFEAGDADQTQQFSMTRTTGRIFTQEPPRLPCRLRYF